MRTDEYTDLRLEHYLVVTDRRVLVSGRSLPNGALAARLRLVFSDRSWIMLAPSLGDRGGKVDRLVAALQPMQEQGRSTG